MYVFPATRLGESSTLKVNLRNNSYDTHEVSYNIFMVIISMYTLQIKCLFLISQCAIIYAFGLSSAT